MSLRYKFGPKITGVYPRPDVPGELPDVDVTAGVKSVKAGDPGLIHVDVAFQVPPYDPAASNPIVELHAVAYLPGHGIPTDPALAIAGDQPRGSTASTGSSGGGEVLVTIPNAPTGFLTIVTVLGYADAAPTPPSPAEAAVPTTG